MRYLKGNEFSIELRSNIFERKKNIRNFDSGVILLVMN